MSERGGLPAAVGVCGLGRCGSTMAMGMLIAGGVPAVPGSEDPPHEGVDVGDVRELAGRCVKLLTFPPPDSVGVLSWRLVWLDRNPVEQARSQRKMLAAFGGLAGRDADLYVARAVASFAGYRASLLGGLRRVGRVVVLDYEQVLANPRRAARSLRSHVWPGLDVDGAAGVVHRRDGRCRSDLSVEERMCPSTAWLSRRG